MKSIREAVEDGALKSMSGIKLKKLWDVWVDPMSKREVRLLNPAIIGYCASHIKEILRFDGLLESREQWEENVEPMCQAVKGMKSDGLMFTDLPEDIKRETFKRGRAKLRRLALQYPRPYEPPSLIRVDRGKAKKKHEELWKTRKETLQKKSLHVQETPQETDSPTQEIEEWQINEEEMSELL